MQNGPGATFHLGGALVNAPDANIEIEGRFDVLARVTNDQAVIEQRRPVRDHG